MASADSLSNAGLARLFGLTTRSITDLCARGIVVRHGKRFDRDEAVLVYVSYLREMAAGRGQASGGAAAVSERARLAAAQADAVEMKNKITRGELVSGAEIESTWTEIVLRARSAVLSVASRVASELPHLSRHDVSTIDRALRDALTALGQAQ
jgi:terminase small subunit / prophage DNA-packing protein